MCCFIRRYTFAQVNSQSMLIWCCIPWALALKELMLCLKIITSFAKSPLHYNCRPSYNVWCEHQDWSKHAEARWRASRFYNSANLGGECAPWWLGNLGIVNWLFLGSRGCQPDLTGPGRARRLHYAAQVTKATHCYYPKQTSWARRHRRQLLPFFCLI